MAALNEGRMRELNIREKIELRFDELEAKLSLNGHLGSEGAAEVAVLIASISKFTSILSEEQRDFLNSAWVAVEDQLTWS